MSFASLDESDQGYLSGHLLIAMPGMDDERFARSVVFVCAHSVDGAMGLVINKPAPDLSLPDLLVQLEIVSDDEAIRLPPQIDRMPVLMGGPVDSSRGFVLHSADYAIDESTLQVDGDICLTATVDILRAIASGGGPREAVLALGYAGWSPGQLEGEIRRNGWLNCPADPGLIFGASAEDKYDRAMRLMGVDPAMLSMSAGRA
ncbi:MAG: YqgE/AlgH family protein [Salinarimonadaceae bacterium]|nr:MAG: YqgE/AlgH family protein [Salinarimonadaceae bacterium]